MYHQVQNPSFIQNLHLLLYSVPDANSTPTSITHGQTRSVWTNKKHKNHQRYVNPNNKHMNTSDWATCQWFTLNLETGFNKSWISQKCLCGTWWRLDWDDDFQPEGRGFDSRSSRHVGTLGKSLTYSCLWRFGVKLRHSIRAVVGSASEQ